MSPYRREEFAVTNVDACYPTPLSALSGDREPRRNEDSTGMREATVTAGRGPGFSGLGLPWNRYKLLQKACLLSRMGSSAIINFGNSTKEKRKKSLAVKL